ncbi:MAG: efflux RND transporter permease subunit [Spirochaetota bacterium]
MIRKLQHKILLRPVTTTMFFLAVALFGVLSFRELKINLLPDFSFPKVTIITAYPNSAAEEVENLITKPITESIGTISGLARIDSESIESYSFITVQFKNSKDTNFALMELRERIDLIRDLLPQDASKPILTRYDPSQAPIAEIVFFNDGLANPRNLRNYINDNIKIYLDRIDGVAAVQLTGGDKKEVLIDVDPQRMYSYKLSLDNIERFLDSNNKNFPAGQLPVGNKDLLIRLMGEFSSVDDIRNVVIGMNEQGAQIALREFSQISEGYRKRTGQARYNGKDCVIAYIFKESSKNTVEITENLKQELANIQKRFGKKVKVKLVYEEASFIKESINNLVRNLAFGTILAFFALLVILRNFKSPLILLLVVPLTLLPTFIFFRVFHISLNLMSLGGLALGIGMLFDNSNVVLSGIERNLARISDTKQAVLAGSSEVVDSIFSATMTTVIVFLPITFIESIIGIVFAEMALAIVISLLVSLTVALTFIPLLAWYFNRKRHTEDKKDNSIVKFLQRREESVLANYSKRLQFLLRHPGKILSLLPVLLLLAFIFFDSLKKEFVSSVDTGEFSIQIQAPSGYSLEATSEIVSSIESELFQESAVKSVISNIGYDEDNITSGNKNAAGSNTASIRVLLKEQRNTTSREFLQVFRRKLSFTKDIKLKYKPGGDIVSSLLSESSGELEFLLLGDDLQELSEQGKRIVQELNKFSGVVDVTSSMKEKSAELKLQYDAVKLAKFRLDKSTVAGFLKTAITGKVASKIKLSGYEVGIRIRLQERYTKTMESIRKLRIKSNVGDSIAISQFATVQPFQNLNSILRRGNTRANLISVSLDKNLADETSDNIAKYIQSLNLPEGYSMQFSGERENLDKSLSELLFAFCLATLLIYMLLSGQFESLKYSLLMLASIPLIFIGSFPALFFSGKSLNVSSFMGIILLIGVVVDNATLFFEYFKLKLAEGLDLHTAILESGKIVIKPILMNNSTTILGLMPVVLGLGKGGEFQAPLGVVVVSGLVSSAFLTLFIIPMLFYKFYTPSEESVAQGH